jgi:hypothetical protein
MPTTRLRFGAFMTHNRPLQPEILMLLLHERAQWLSSVHLWRTATLQRPPGAREHLGAAPVAMRPHCRRRR